jgi:hypothetical protein
MPLAFIDRSASRRQLPPVHETDLDHILKLIPTEVLALYTAASPIADQLRAACVPLALFLVGIGLVPLVLFLDGRTVNAPASWPQYVVRTLTFIAWALAISWPLTPWLAKGDLTWVTSLAVMLVPLVGGYVLRSRAVPR